MKLDVSNHNLTSFSNYDLNRNYSIHNITIFDLSSNLFSSIPNNLNQFINLIKIDISHNQLTDVDFRDLPLKLQWISLKDNQISCISCSRRFIDRNPRGVVENFSNLNFLDLSNNGLSEIPEFFSSTFNNLKTLFINDNFIKKLPKVLPSKLEHLDLSENRIRSFDSLRPLKSLKFLRFLKCRGNTIENFPSYTFICGNIVEGLEILDDKQFKAQINNADRVNQLKENFDTQEDLDLQNSNQEESYHDFVDGRTHSLLNLHQIDTINSLNSFQENTNFNSRNDNFQLANQYDDSPSASNFNLISRYNSFRTSIGNYKDSGESIGQLSPNSPPETSRISFKVRKSIEEFDTNSVTNFTPNIQENYNIYNDSLSMQPQELDQEQNHKDNLEYNNIVQEYHSINIFTPNSAIPINPTNQTSIASASQDIEFKSLTNENLKQIEIKNDEIIKYSPSITKSPSRTNSSSIPWYPPGIAEIRKSSPSRNQSSKNLTKKIVKSQSNSSIRLKSSKTSPQTNKMKKNNSFKSNKNTSLENIENFKQNEIIENDSKVITEVLDSNQDEITDHVQNFENNDKSSILESNLDTNILLSIDNKNSDNKVQDNNSEDSNNEFIKKLLEENSGLKLEVAYMFDLIEAIHREKDSMKQKMETIQQDMNSLQNKFQSLTPEKTSDKFTENKNFNEEFVKKKRKMSSPSRNHSLNKSFSSTSSNYTKKTPLTLKNSDNLNKFLNHSRKSNSSKNELNFDEKVSLIMNESTRLRKEFQPEYILTPIQITDKTKAQILTEQRIENYLQSNLKTPDGFRSFDDFSILKEDRFETGKFANATKKFLNQLRSPTPSPSEERKKRSRTKNSWRQNSLKDFEEEYEYQKILNRSLGSILEENSNTSFNEDDSSFTNYHELRTKGKNINF